MRMTTQEELAPTKTTRTATRTTCALQPHCISSACDPDSREFCATAISSGGVALWDGRVQVAFEASAVCLSTYTSPMPGLIRVCPYTPWD